MKIGEASMSNPVDEHVGGRVRFRRTLLGVTQQQLAEGLGVTFQQVQKYEKGANRIGSSRLYDLSTILDVPVGYFFDEMPEAVKERSPAKMLQARDINFAEEIENQEPRVTKRETLELVRAYYKVKDPALRKRMLDMTRALGVLYEE
jgi:transcriptional regulator with XRE-family HTH domain